MVCSSWNEQLHDWRLNARDSSARLFKPRAGCRSVLRRSLSPDSCRRCSPRRRDNTPPGSRPEAASAFPRAIHARIHAAVSRASLEEGTFAAGRSGAASAPNRSSHVPSCTSSSAGRRRGSANASPWSASSSRNAPAFSRSTSRNIARSRSSLAATTSSDAPGNGSTKRASLSANAPKHSRLRSASKCASPGTRTAVGAKASPFVSSSFCTCESVTHGNTPNSRSTGAATTGPGRAQNTVHEDGHVQPLQAQRDERREIRLLGRAGMAGKHDGAHAPIRRREPEAALRKRHTASVQLQRARPRVLRAAQGKPLLRAPERLRPAARP